MSGTDGFAGAGPDGLFPIAGAAGNADGGAAGTAGTTDPAAGTAGGTTDPAAGAAGTVDYIAIATEKGWRPKEEYEGDPDGWVDAEEFVKRQPLFDKIKGQSKKLKELEKTVEALAKHYNTNIQQAKERAIADLKNERKDAIQLGHADRVDEIDLKIEDIKKIEEPVSTTSKPVLPTEIENFVEEQKSWFNVDREMTAFAISFNEAYLKDHPGKLEESLKKTLEKIKLAYPEKFVNARRETPNPVDGGGTPPAGGSEGKYSVNRLSPEQKIVYNQLVKTHKQITHEQYFKDLEEAGYLAN